LKLSSTIFKWEVQNKIDSLETLFHSKFVVVGSDGKSQLKNQYISRLKSGSFVHDSIKVEEQTAVVSGNTAIVSGKGRFYVTLSGNKVQLHLSYMEVFTRENIRKQWQVLAMKANILDN
jgi:predicted ABC-type sugar transport system permease subunit